MYSTNKVVFVVVFFSFDAAEKIKKQTFERR